MIVGTGTRELEQAAEILRDGGIVAFPTETYYGLAVDPFNEMALARLYRAKERPPDKPVLVLVEHRRQLDRLVADTPDIARVLMEKFWPGPLTLVLPARDDLPAQLTGNTSTVGVRRSSHILARALVRTCATPVTATSANLSGHPPAVSAAEVEQAMGDRIDIVLDGGVTPGRLGSTLVGFGADGIIPIREGLISFEDLRSRIAADGDRQGP